MWWKWWKRRKKAPSKNGSTEIESIEERAGSALRDARDKERHERSLGALLQWMALKKRIFPPSIVAYLGEQIASELAEASKAPLEDGLVRARVWTVSPHNIVVDSEGRLRLSDLDAAKGPEGKRASRYGRVRGAPSYMAPEQVMGLEVDARADVFALGIVMYECACLKRLFGRSNPVKSMEAVVNASPQPLTERDRKFPVELWKVIERALQKEPERRWQTAEELALALREVARSLPGAAEAQRDLNAIADSAFGDPK